MAMIAEESRTYTSQEVADAIGLAYGTLMHWVKIGLLTPKGAKAGRRRSVIWDDRDLAEARNLAAFRGRRLSVVTVKKAMMREVEVSDQ